MQVERNLSSNISITLPCLLTLAYEHSTSAVCLHSEPTPVRAEFVFEKF